MFKKLSDHKSAQCVVSINRDNSIDFYSYKTRVLSFKENEDHCLICECTGTYSQTTRRQISWFLKEYFPDLSYFDMKAIAGCGYKKVSEILNS